MRYRLDAQHYIHDRLLEPGHIVGDGTDVPFREVDGEPMIPSASMTPIDGEAQSLFTKKFPNAKLPRKSALEAIPIREVDGVVQQPNYHGPVETGGPGPWVLDPDGEPTGELKKGLPDSGSPNSPVGQTVVGTPPAPGTVPVHPRPAPQDQGQPPGAPLKQVQAPTPPPPFPNTKPPAPTQAQPAPPKAPEQKK